MDGQMGGPQGRGGLCTLGEQSHLAQLELEALQEQRGKG